MTKDGIRAAVSANTLIRVRRGRYLPAGTHPIVLAAAACGGLVDCVTLLQLLGVFVLAAPGLHVHVPVGASRLPPPRSHVVRHWRPGPDDALSTLADIVEAIAQAVRCQPPRAAVATLDSAVHLRLLDDASLDRVFALLPRRYAVLRELIDGRAESGTETLVRLILRTIGCRVGVQVEIPGVGRVDLLVDGWLIIECDSRAHHSDWEDVCRDRRRDVEAAAQGFTTVRLLADDVFRAPDEVGHSLRRILSAPRRMPHAGAAPRRTPHLRRSAPAMASRSGASAEI